MASEAGHRSVFPGDSSRVLAEQALERLARAAACLVPPDHELGAAQREDEAHEVERELARVGSGRELAGVDGELDGLAQLAIELLLALDHGVPQRAGLVLVFARRRVDGAAARQVRAVRPG